MTANIVNQVAYLRNTREYPEDLPMLATEVSRSYIDIATAVNNRTIGIFPRNRAAITGESWFLTNQRQQTLRQVYSFTTTTSIPHGLTFSEIFGFSRLFGTYTDGTNWYGIIPGSNVAIAGQIGFYLDPTNIVFTVGAGAPTVTSGTIVLEWLSHI